jgi:hypothetical protein
MWSDLRHRKGVTFLHAQQGLVDAVGGDTVVSVDVGAGVCFGSGPLDHAEDGAASGGGGGAQRRGRHPRTRSPSSQSACFGEQTATGSRSSA